MKTFIAHVLVVSLLAGCAADSLFSDKNKSKAYVGLRSIGEGSNGGVLISWAKPESLEGAITYLIFGDGDRTQQVAAVNDALSFEFLDFVPGHAYTFSVTAVSVDTGESVLGAVTMPYNAPSAAVRYTGITSAAAASATAITITYPTAARADYYGLYDALGDFSQKLRTVPYRDNANALTTSYVVGGLVTGASYSFTLRACVVRGGVEFCDTNFKVASARTLSSLVPESAGATGARIPTSPASVSEIEVTLSEPFFPVNTNGSEVCSTVGADRGWRLYAWNATTGSFDSTRPAMIKNGASSASFGTYAIYPKASVIVTQTDAQVPSTLLAPNTQYNFIARAVCIKNGTTTTVLSDINSVVVTARTLTSLPPPAPPNPTGVSPSAAGLNDLSTIVITATLLNAQGDGGFQNGASATVDGLPCTGAVVDSSTSMHCDLPPGNSVGTKTIVVTNPDGGSKALSGAFRYTNQLAPELYSVAPTSGPSSGLRLIVLSGDHFRPGGASAITVRIGTELCDNPTLGPLNGSGEANTLSCVTRPQSAGSKDVVFTDGDGRQATLSGGYSYVPGPTISSITPTSDSLAGGKRLTVTGTGFFGTNSTFLMTVGSRPCTNVVLVSDTQAKCDIPSQSTQGPKSVTVKNPDNQTGSFASLTYVGPPVVTSIVPDGGPLGGGTLLTISGSNFIDTPTLPTVTVGGVPCTGVVFQNSARLQCTVGAHAAGPADVRVANADFQFSTLPAAFTYSPAPVLTSVVPFFGPTLGGQQITLSGSGFLTNPQVVLVAGNGNTQTVSASNIISVSATSIVLTTPFRGIKEVVDVKIINSDSQESNTQKYSFTDDGAPTISSLDPAAGRENYLNVVNMYGSNFSAGASITFLNGTNEYPATGIVVTNSGQLSFTTPSLGALPGGLKYDLRYTNSDLQSVTVPALYEILNIPAPIGTSFSPTFGPLAGGNTVTILGSNFYPTIFPTVTFGGVAVTGSNRISATTTQIVVRAPANPASGVSIVVKNVDGQLTTLPGTYYYTSAAAPTFTSISPNIGRMAGQSRTVTGTNFRSGASVDFISGGGTRYAATGVSFVSSTTLTLNTPTLPAGFYDVEVRNPDSQKATGTAVYQSLIIPAPTVASISPTFGPPAGGTTTTITGTNFYTTIFPTVTFCGTAVTVPNQVSVTATQIVVNTPARAAAQCDVVVTNADGQSATLPASFNYTSNAAPTVASISPQAGRMAAEAVTITGANFRAGALVFFVSGGTSYPATTSNYVNATTVTATTPTPVLAVGNYDVVVRNTDTQIGTGVALYRVLNIPAPTLASLSPSFGGIAGGTTVTILGTNFYTPLFPGVSFCGTPVTNPADRISVTATQIVVKTPARAAALGCDVVVTNADGQSATLLGAYNYTTGAAPTVTAINQNFGAVAGDTRTVTGTNFVAGAQVTFIANAGGTRYAASTTTFNSATQLTVVTPTPTALPAGYYDVEVKLPDTQTAVLAGGFQQLNLPAPTLTSVSPSSGIPSGGTTVTLTGTNFYPGVFPTVTFGGVSVTVANQVSATATSIVVRTPSNSTGFTDVRVTNVDGKFAQLNNGFNYIPNVQMTQIASRTFFTNTPLPVASTISGTIVNTITGDNTGLTLNCVFDTLLDGAVSPGSNCSLLAGFTLDPGFANNGIFAFTPNASQGERSFEFKVTADDGTSQFTTMWQVTVTSPMKYDSTLKLAYQPGLASGGLNPGVSSPFTTTWTNLGADTTLGNGSLTSGIFATGWVGNGTLVTSPFALNFAGNTGSSADRVIGGSHLNSITTPMFTAWIRPTNTALNTLAYVFGNRDTSSTSGWAVRQRVDNTFEFVVGSGTTVITPQNAILALSPSAYFQFEDTTAGQARDAVTNTVMTVVNAGQVTQNVTGAYSGSKAFTFASNGHAILSPKVTHNTGLYTVAAWVLTPLPANGQWKTMVRGQNNDHQIIFRDSNNDFGSYVAGGFRTSGLNANSGLTAGWHQFVAVGMGTSIRYFVDGTFISAAATNSSVEDFYAIGNYQAGGQPIGTIDDLGLWNRSLSDSEVNSLFALTCSATAPQAQWSHLGGFFDGTNGRLFLNGAQRCIFTPSGGTANGATANFSIGARNDGSQAWPGRVGSVYVYNSGNGTDIATNYSAEIPKYYFTSCLALRQAGNTTSGLYTIDPDAGGPLSAQSAYCDMTTDGGGWTMVLNYSHRAATTPTQSALTTRLPLLGADTLGTDESGSSTAWGHVAPALLNQMSFNEMRFACRTSLHSRVLDFKTTSSNCRIYAKTGGNTTSCADLVTLNTPLPGHTAFLPAQMNAANNNNNTQALTNHTFYRGSTYHWNINQGSRWECDDYANGPANDTIHKVWVR